MTFSEWFTGVMIVVTGVLLAEIIISITNMIARAILTRRERAAAQPPAEHEQVDAAYASARHALFEPADEPVEEGRMRVAERGGDRRVLRGRRDG